MSPLFRLPWRSRAAIDRDVDTELQFHLDARIAELEREGQSPAEARRRAQEEFGDLEFTRRYCRDLDQRAERRVRLADRSADWAQDFRFALRTLRKSPGFAIVSILTLALAIGANTAIFSVARAVLLKPLGFGNPGQLVAMFESPVDNPQFHGELSPPNLVDYRAQQSSLAGLGGYMWRTITWQPDNAPPAILTGISVTVDLFGVLQVPAWRGRTFRDGDDAPGAATKTVLSYRFWERNLGADSLVVGRTIVLDHVPYDVIGIMPKGFLVVGEEDLWVPLDLSEFMATSAITRKQHFVHGIARLKPGVALATARADIETISRRLQREYPEANARSIAALVPLHEALTENFERPVLLLLTAAGLVLLIACGNLANVTLSRTIGRRSEIAVRSALGAGRARLARQLLTESTLLALAGGGLGVALALVGTKALLALNPNTLPPRFEIGIDGGVLAFSLALSIGTGVLFGLAPALGASRADLQSALKENARGGTPGRTAERVRRGLAVGQVALAVVLLVGAGLLTRSMQELIRVHLGFDPDRVLTAQLRVDGPRYDSTWAVNQLYDGLFEEIARAPGIVAVGASTHLPTEGSWGTSLVVEGSAEHLLHPAEIRHAIVRGDFFGALRVPIVAGRIFSPADRVDGPKVVLVNESAARQHFPKGEAVGRRVRIGPNPAAPWMTIIGVVGDVRDRRLEEPAGPTIYLNGRQETWIRTMSVVIRTSGDPETAAPAFLRAVKAGDPSLGLRDIRSLDQVIGSSLGSRRFGLALAASFAGLALLLAAIGIYGVQSYSVTSRTREFGVRMALGATPRGVLLLVLRQGLGWSLLGLGLGVAVALAGGRVLTTLLYEVRPIDLATYAAVAIGLFVVVAVACLIPAAKATAVDPLASTRAD